MQAFLSSKNDIAGAVKIEYGFGVERVPISRKKTGAIAPAGRNDFNRYAERTTLLRRFLPCALQQAQPIPVHHILYIVVVEIAFGQRVREMLQICYRVQIVRR